MAPAGHDLHGHTALKYHLVLKAVDRGLLGRGQLLPEGVVLLLGHGAVDIVRRSPVIPGAEPGLVHVHALGGDPGGRRVVEVEGGVRPQQGLEPLRQGVGGQGAGGDDHLPLRDLGHLAGHHGDMGVAADLLRHHAGEAVAVLQCRRPPPGWRRRTGGSGSPAAAAPLSKGPQRFPAGRSAGSWSSTAPRSIPSHGRGSFFPASSPGG